MCARTRHRVHVAITHSRHTFPRIHVISLIVALLIHVPLLEAQAPDEDWRVLETAHFRVNYPLRLRDLAVRVADRAERAHQGLTQALKTTPAGTIEVVVSDHTDIPNGFATVSPWNRITIFSALPLDGFELGYFDEWIRLVVTHELAHIFHLDQQGRPGALTRTIFGRAPLRWPVFPNHTLPEWAIEGLATHYESALTGTGRAHGTFQDMVLRTAVLEDALESLPQMSGKTAVWPGGNRPYVYGAGFFTYLVDRYGPTRMAEFVRAVGNQLVPFRLNAAASKTFGTTFNTAYEEWIQTLRDRYATLMTQITSLRPLTHSDSLSSAGQWALYPRVAPDGNTVAYARANGASVPGIYLLSPTTSVSRSLTRSNNVSRLDWTPDGQVVFSQVDFVDPYRTYRDLYLADPGSGHVRRLTHGARLDYPSVSPDGSEAFAVQQVEGRTALVRVNLYTSAIETVVPPADGVHWVYPSWSPDGHWIAVARWKQGAFYDIVLLDSTGAIRERITHDRAVDLAPSWSPDGRHLLWASDRTGIPNLFATHITLDGSPGAIRQITNFSTGGAYPAVDPSGTWIYFSGYHADGWHIERIPYDPGSWATPFPFDTRFRTRDTALDHPTHVETSTLDRDYSPFPSIWPTYWLPTLAQGETHLGRQVLGPRLGFVTQAVDVIQRHAAAVSFSVEPRGKRFSGGLGYAFAGFGNPVLGVSIGQHHRSTGFTIDDADRELPARRDLFLVTREQEARADISTVRRRVRRTVTASLGASYIREHQQLLDEQLAPETRFAPIHPTRSLMQLDGRLGLQTAQLQPFSISLEDGIRAFTHVRRRWDTTAPDARTHQEDARSFTDLTSELNIYKSLGRRGFANQLLAVRMSGGAAWNTGADAFFYSAGGTPGQAERITGLGLVPATATLFPIRGYPRGIRSGSRAWSASIEYRVPIGQVNRALGNLPLYLDWISATLFADAGNAWAPRPHATHFAALQRAPLSSLGGELLLSGLPLWTTSTQLRVGVAVPLADHGLSFYVRLGRTF